MYFELGCKISTLHPVSYYNVHNIFTVLQMLENVAIIKILHMSNEIYVQN
jgi:hypothetical protein